MTQIPFIRGAYGGRSTNVNAQACINLFPETEIIDDKTNTYLVGRPGLELFCTPDSDVEVRGLKVVNDKLYAVCSDKVYSITTTGVSTLHTGVLLTTTGPVWMEEGQNYLVIVDGTYGYYVDLSGTSVVQIPDADFPTVVSSLSYMDTYWIVTSGDSGQFYTSDSADPLSWDALYFATAEGRADDLVTQIVSHRELWLFGENSTEVWYDAGGATFQFNRVSGVFLEIGCGAAHSPALFDNSVVWLTNERQIVRADGYKPKPISTRQIEYQIAQYSDVSDAIGFSYIFEGHPFYQITFPTADKTWVYDASTKLWHELTSYPDSLVDLEMGRHRGNCYARFNTKHYMGDYANGNIYEVKSDYYTDNENNIEKIRTGPVIVNTKKWFFINSFEVAMETGTGILDEEGDDPQAMLQWSDDGGHTWSNELWSDLSRPIGAIGEYSNVVKWFRLGRSRNRIFRVKVIDPVKVVMIDAFMDAESE